jgi:hypothetical protein
MKNPNAEITSRLKGEKNIWIATVRPNGKPHLVPVWFVWQDSSLYICISSTSVKYLNIAKNKAVSLSLEDGSTPVICEGIAEPVSRPWPRDIIHAFKGKYDWQIDTDEEYDALVQILPEKWLSWA